MILFSFFMRAKEWNRTTIQALQEPCNNHYTTLAFAIRYEISKNLLFDIKSHALIAVGIFKMSMNLIW